jgi:GNAT superfamily N-acetyltransferase
VSRAQATRPSLANKIAERIRFGLLTLELLNRFHRLTGLCVSAYAVFCGEIDDLEPPQQSSESIEFRALRDGDLAAVAALAEHEPRKQAGRAADLARRMQGSLGFGAFVDGRPIAYCWADLEKCRVPLVNSVLFAVNEDEAAAYDFYVGREFRGRRVGPALRRVMIEQLAADGRARMYRTVPLLNKSSMRVVARSRARKLETRLTLGFPRWLVVDVRLAGAEPGLRTKRILLTKMPTSGSGE